jgi:hypothetical protein
VWNESDYIIEDIYVTQVDTFDWGPDLLGGDVLRSGESITIAVDCDVYDIKVIDETGVECELHDIDVCLEDDGWVIDDVTLDACAFDAPAFDASAVPRHGHETEATPQGKAPAR